MPASSLGVTRLRQARTWFQRASLWQRLALMLVPALLIVTASELWLTRHDALGAANAAYDRSVLGALKAIDANISTASGGLSVELPYTMFEFFELTASGRVYFRVATSDGLVELGSADLPEPPFALVPGVPAFYDAEYFGEPVRFAAYRRALDLPSAKEDGARSVLVQVGESTKSRQDFTARFVRRAALRDSLVLAALMLATSLGLVAALRPLRRFAREVQARHPEDLTQIEEVAIPADIRPLVSAVNQHMARTKALVTQQRQFLDDASHQLRTHLTTLQMQADYAQREDDPRELKAALEAMRIEIGRVTRTTQQLLALGRSDTASLEFETVDLAELLREVALGLLPMARARHIDLGIAPLALHGPAVADAALLREALGNLVANALAYTPEHGKVTLDARDDDAARWQLSVEDNGPGMSEAELASIGQRFRRGRRAAQGGSGLGLAIAASIAQRHGGGLALGSVNKDGGGHTGLRACIWWPQGPTSTMTAIAPQEPMA